MALRRLVAPVIVLALVVAAALTFFGGEDRKTLTAHFPRTVSIYEGSDVRVLGVPIGTVDTVTPSGTDVVVTMSYDADTEIPADAKAVIVAPSIVGDRFVQLTPVFEQGDDVLADGATLDEDQTAVPLELDQIYSSLDDLTVALGPTGANSKGALTDLLESTAANFGGQGEQFHQTVEDFSQLSQTLDDNKEELFGSAARLEGFIGTLARNDSTVRRFNQSLAQVASVLEGERGDLRASLRNLGSALGEVSTFVQENREVLGRNIQGLNRVAKVLVKQRGALDEILTAGPLALNNLALTYNPQAGTLDTRANIGELPNQIAADPAAFLCSIVDQVDTSGGTVRPDQPRPAARRLRPGRRAHPRPLRPDPRRPGGGAAVMTRLKALLLLLVTSVALSGCDFDVYELPLPGGTDVGDDPIMVTVQVPRRARPRAQVDGQGERRQRRPGHRHHARRLHRRGHPRPAERRRAARQRDRRAAADQPPRREVRLPQPADQRRHAAQLESGDVIELDDTGRNPEVEEVLGALSLMLNGGGVAQLQTIARELNRALEGREDSARSVLRQVELLTGQLDDNKQDIVAAIDSLNRLAISVNDQTDSIDSALEELPSALRTIDKQRGDLVKMLQSLNDLGDVGVRVIKASKDATIETATEPLGCCVKRAARCHLGAVAGLVKHAARYAEVGEHHPAVVAEVHIGGFDVAVQDAGTVSCHEYIEQAKADAGDLSDRKGPLHCDQLGERAPRQRLHYDPVLAVF